MRVIPAVILAGGRGSRMGGGKAARMLDGKPLIEHMLNKAGFYSDIIAVAGARRGDMECPPNVTFLADEDDGAGPIAGLASALAFAASGGNDLVLTLPCDTPFLPDNLLHKLQTAMGDAHVAIPHCQGGLHPACGLWRVHAAKSLGVYLAQGRRSLIGFAEAVGFVAAEWMAEPFDPFFNINTPEELAAAEKIVSLLPASIPG